MASIWDFLDSLPKRGDVSPEELAARRQGYADLYQGGLLARNRDQMPLSVQGAQATQDFMPVIGDALALGEAGEALSRGELAAAGLLGTAGIIGLVPGVGDALAKPVMAAGRRAADIARRIEVDPNAFGSMGGNIRLRPQGVEEDIGGVLSKKYPEVALDLFGDPDRGYELSRIVVPEGERSSGIGSKVMRDIVNMADAQGAKVSLTPDSSFGGNKTRLKDFYKRFGFVENKGRNKDFSTRNTMYREPQPQGLLPPASPAQEVAGLLSSGRVDEAPATGIRAYHGSPHSFDKFSMDAIGTGEGAQAYGHGLYFAEAEDVAKKYRDDLSGWSSAGAERTLEAVGGDVDRAILETQQKLDRLIERSKTGAFQGAERNFNMQRQIQEDKIAQLEKYKRTGNFDAGSMYEVNINANPEDFLDWDAPAPQQSDRVRKALTSIANSDPEVMSKFREAMARGDSGSIYEAILQDKTGTVAGNQAGAAKRLQESGILGIKYKDAGSRGTDAATRNYVVFDDNLINIVKKYGIAGAAAMLGVSAMDVEQAMAQGAPQPQPQGLLGGAR